MSGVCFGKADAARVGEIDQINAKIGQLDGNQNQA
jgi:hypothetical protein